MARVLIIGAGGVGSVVAHKCASVPEVFTEIMLASRTKAKCDAIAAHIGGNRIKTAQVDADNVEETIRLLESYKPDLLINVALPYQDLPLMDACLATKTNYMDTANYEPRDKAKFEYSWQWAYHDRFKEAGVRLSTLSNYGSLIDEATSAGVVKASDAEVLRSWRLNPANWGND